MGMNRAAICQFVGFVVCFGWLLTNVGYGQIVVRGIIRDAVSQEKIPYVSLYNPATQTGTLTNENGDFELTVSALPVQLVASHVSYETDTLLLTSDVSQPVALRPATRELATVTVSNLGYKLIALAIARIETNSKNQLYGKAFYRQLVRHGDQPTELQEVFYDVRLSPVGIDGIRIDNARFGKVPSNSDKLYSNFSNFSYVVLAQKTMSMTKPSPNTVVYPLRTDVADYYTVQVVNMIEQANGDKIAELACQVRPDYLNPALSGTVFINTTTNNLVKVVGHIPHSLGAAFDNAKSSSAKHIYAVTNDYGSRDGLAFLSSVRVGLTYVQRLKKRAEERSVNIDALLIINDLSGTTAQSRFKSIDINREDLREIQKAKYNPSFWQNNPVVRRTPLEDDAIKAFEQQGVIGTMRPDGQ